jgi:DNA-binding transcriptional regulator GbsR (MarR family)
VTNLRQQAKSTRASYGNQQERGANPIVQERINDIRDVLTIIDSILSWESLSKESREQLLVFKSELQQELRSLVQVDLPKAA